MSLLADISPRSPNVDLGAFRLLVETMRELGVVSAFGIVLGPEPAKAQKLASEQKHATGERKRQIDQELAEELRNSRIREALDEVRDKLAATGKDYSDEQLRKFIAPERWAEINAQDA